MLTKPQLLSIVTSIVDGAKVDRAVIAFDNINKSLEASSVDVPTGVMALLGSAALQISESLGISQHDANTVIVEILTGPKGN